MTTDEVSNLVKVISGGQTGVDQAALRAAKTSGLASGGWCPPGRLCESGIISAEFHLTETPNERSADAPDIARSQRTEWNVRDSDATLVLQPAGGEDPGTTWAIRCAKKYSRAFFECDPADQQAMAKIITWLRPLQIHTLNVAGPSEGSAPGIGEQTYTLLVGLFASSLDF